MKWVLQKWEEEMQVETLLRPTPSTELIPANVCKALTDRHGSFQETLQEVEALLRDDWEDSLHVTVLDLLFNNMSWRHAISGP